MSKQLIKSINAISDYYANNPEQQQQISKSLNAFDPESGQLSHWIYGITRSDTMTIKSLFFSELWVWACVDLIASEFSKLWPVVKRKVVDKSGKELTEDVADHPVQLRLETPNNEYSTSDFLYLMAAEYCLTGNALAYEKSGSGLWHLPSELIEPDISAMGELKNYLWSYDIYNNPGNSPITVHAIPAKNVMHIQRRNPSNRFWGLSPFVPASRETQLSRYSSEFLLGYFEKGTSPQQILSLDTAVSEAQLLRMLRSFELAYTGRRNQRRTLMLPKGVSATTVFNKIADPELIKTINDNKDDIRAVLKTPPHAFGLQKSGSLGSEEHKTALNFLWEATILPMAKAIGEGFARFYSRAMGPGEYIEFDTKDVSVLQETYIKKTEKARGMLDTGLTVNEVRQEVWEREPIPGGDVSPVLMGAATPSPFGGLQLSSPPQAEIKELLDPVEEYVKSIDKELDLHHKSILKAEDMGAKAYSKIVLDLLATQGEMALEAYHKMTKAFDVDAFKKQIEESFATLGDTYIKDHTTTLKATMDTGASIQLRFTFNKPNADQVEALTSDAEGTRVIALQERAFDAFQGLSQTSTDDMVREVKAGLEASESPQQIVARLAKKVSEWPTYRLERITRTEALTALSLGQAGTMESMKEVYGKGLKARWSNSKDSKVRDDHQIDGETIEWGGEFSNGLKFPRDPAGQASNVINCRCSMIPIIPEGEQ